MSEAYNVLAYTYMDKQLFFYLISFKWRDTYSQTQKLNILGGYASYILFNAKRIFVGKYSNEMLCYLTKM